MKKIKVDIYQTEVLAFGDYNSLEKYCKKHNVQMQERSYDGLAASIEASTGLAGVLVSEDGSGEFFVAIRDRCITTLAHECLHVTYYILENVGVPVDFRNQEAVAYLFQYIFEQSLFKLNMAAEEYGDVP